MDPVFLELATNIQKQAERFLPQAYSLGKRKAEQKYGVVQPWSDRDNANIELLLTRHADELAKSMAALERLKNAGKPIDQILEAFLGRAGLWSWAAAPAMVMGLSAYTDQNRNEIGRAENLDPNDIGILWLTAEDERVCPRCLFLAGRWFDARNAYDIASTIHPGCRCPAHFDVATPDEAMVGPIPNYKPGTAEMVYADLGADPLIQARHARAGRGKPSEYAKPKVNIGWDGYLKIKLAEQEEADAVKAG